MAFIKAQKIVRDENGVVTSGSASIVDTVYVSTGAKSHSKQVVREKLGKVLYLSEDRKCGIFMSPTRGLIEYDALTDSFSTVEQGDPRINGHELFPEAEIHTVFGDSYLLLNFLEKCGMIAVLRKVFPENEAYERVLCHVLHDVLRDGSGITCDSFIGKSFASYLLRDVKTESLRDDADFYTVMGGREIRLSYFRDFVAAMQAKDPSFGKKCCVDATPLPDDLDSNPFKALRCGGDSPDVTPRLLLVFDEASGLPVWYDVVPGSTPGTTVMTALTKDVAAALNIAITTLVLDADYVSKDLIAAFRIDGQQDFTGRMPNAKGYPFKALYLEMKDLIGREQYTFTHKGRPCFGIRKKIILFKQPVYAYVYVDQPKARKGFAEYLAGHEAAFAGLKDRDKDWYRVRYGYFVLISSIKAEPCDLLADYQEKAMRGIVFMTAGDYLAHMPLEKWTDEAVRGKLLHDMLAATALTLLQQSLSSFGLTASEVFGSCQSLMCSRKKDGTVTIETPCKAVQKCYKALGTSAPAHLKEDAVRTALGL